LKNREIEKEILEEKKKEEHEAEMQPELKSKAGFGMF